MLLELLFNGLLKFGLGKLAEPILDFFKVQTSSADMEKRLAQEERIARMQTQYSAYRDKLEHNKFQMGYAMFWVLVVALMAPMILKWTMINLYDVFWCAKCMYPQDWTIAAYQPPFDAWAESMVAWVFGPAVGAGVVMAASRSLR